MGSSWDLRHVGWHELPFVAQSPLMARILYMTTLPLAEVRANLSKLVESAVTTHERFEVTRNGDRVAVLMSAEDYDSLIETLDILSNPEEVEALRQGLAEAAAGQFYTEAEVREALIARGRRSA
jgi:antitoxin YefM